MLTFFCAYLLCGAVVGFFAGMFGIGGGIIGIPTLLFLFELQGIEANLSMHMAVGTSLLIVMVTAMASTYNHYQRNMIVFPVFKKFIPGAMVGSVLGVAISSHLSHDYLEKIFGIFLLLIAIKMFLQIEVKPEEELKPKKMRFAPLLLGAMSGLLGLGGGVFTVPYFVWYGISIRQAVATSAACIFPIALVGSAGYMLSTVNIQDNPANILLWHTGFIYWPAFIGVTLTSVLTAPLGVKVANSISTDLLKKGFAIFLVLISITMLSRN